MKVVIPFLLAKTVVVNFSRNTTNCMRNLFLQSKGYSNFYVTGSVALIKNFGIPLGREPHDIDIILLGDTTNEEDDKILFEVDGIWVNVLYRKKFVSKSQSS